MRTVFFLLLFINIAFAVYIQSEPASGDHAPSRDHAQPSREEAPPERPQPSREPVACLEWGVFLEADLEQVEAAIAQIQLDAKVDHEQRGKTPVFWIHIPPLKNAFLAEKKMGELGRLGVVGYSRVQNDEKWNNAISMGFFHNIEDAQSALAALRAKGVRSAVIGARNLDQVAFVLRNPSAEDTAKLRILEKKFPGSELKTSQCAP
ncbi:MAG TPA: hypothetical protein VHB01_01785 [Nitrosospira sp.]|nr:hypothetical protein [Nitrosospira sp.]